MNVSYELLHSFNDSIAVIDNKGVILFSNKSWNQFTEENSGDFLKTGCGVNYIEVCRRVEGKDALFAQEVADGLLKVINREVTVFEIEYACHSLSERRWYILRATPFKGFKGQTLLCHINITKQKLAEELLSVSNKQLNVVNSRLNSTLFKIVHDIQGPLNSVVGLINLSKTEENVQNTQYLISLIENSIFNLKDFIQYTLKLSSKNIQSEDVNFKTVFDDFYKSIQFCEALKKVNINFNINQNVPFYSVKTELVSILSNLINNSLKYYDPNKKKSFINVEVIVNNTEAKICISDNGIGISEEHLSSVFDLHFQVDKDAYSGAGVGLFLVKKSVELLKGHIEISAEEGVGTAFNIVFPNMLKADVVFEKAFVTN